MAPRLDKETIDALVDGMPRDEEHRCWVDVSGYRLIADEFRAILYLAAGLTAEGERKPERVRCWLWQQHSKCDRIILVEPNCRLAGVDECFTPGWFVPDGAE